jgi:hypothetical protein
VLAESSDLAGAGTDTSGQIILFIARCFTKHHYNENGIDGKKWQHTFSKRVAKIYV